MNIVEQAKKYQCSRNNWVQANAELLAMSFDDPAYAEQEAVVSELLGRMLAHADLMSDIALDQV